MQTVVGGWVVSLSLPHSGSILTHHSLTVGGGYGVLTGQHGLVIDNLLKVRIVLANGTIVNASDDENQDVSLSSVPYPANLDILLTCVLTPCAAVLRRSRWWQQLWDRYRDESSTTPYPPDLLVRYPYLPHRQDRNGFRGRSGMAAKRHDDQLDRRVCPGPG